MFDELRYTSHLYIAGAPRTGKTGFTRLLIRDDIVNGHSLISIDPHGESTDDTLAYLAYLQPSVPVVLLDLSKGDWIVPYNPGRWAGNPEVNAAIQADLLMKVWGGNKYEFPTLQRMLRAFLLYCATSGETIVNAARLLDFSNKDKLPIGQHEIWTRLQNAKTFREWDDYTLSTVNRLDPFLRNPAIRRYMAIRQSVPLADWIRHGSIILVNLKQSENLDKESGRIFAALLIADLFHSAMNALPERLDCHVYCDEFQTYITSDLADMLDQVLKAGISLTLAHHNLGQVDDKHLVRSLMTGCKIKAVFGGLAFEDALFLVPEMMLGSMNERWEKERIYHVSAVGVEEREHVYRTESETESEGDSEGESGSESSSNTVYEGGDTSRSTLKSKGAGESHGHSSSRGMTFSETYSPYLMPIYDEQLSQILEYTESERKNMLASLLVRQEPRNCFLKLPGQDAEAFQVAHIPDPGQSDETISEYRYRVCVNVGALPTELHDRHIAEAESNFLSPSEPEPEPIWKPIKKTRKKKNEQPS